MSISAAPMLSAEIGGGACWQPGMSQSRRRAQQNAEKRKISFIGEGQDAGSGVGRVKEFRSRVVKVSVPGEFREVVDNWFPVDAGASTAGVTSVR